MAKADYNIVISATDNASPVIERVSKKMNLAQQLRQGGDIGEMTAIKKFGKNLGEFAEVGQGLTNIRDTASEMRSAAAFKLRSEFKSINEELASGLATELRSAKLMDLKRQSAEAYKKQIKDINAAESTATKASGGGLIRGLAVGGGVMLAVKAAGELAKAYDLANQKLEKGEITAGMFAGEMAKSLPIIGGVVQSAEMLMMVMSGTAKAIREANREAAILDAKIAGQNKDRKAVDDLVAGVVGLNDSDTQRINREANKKLKEIADVRKAGELSGIINAGNERDIALRRAEKEIIAKREKDLGEVEAREREKRASQIASVEDRLADSRNEIEQQRAQEYIAQLREQGKEEQATIEAIKIETNEKLAALDRERAKLQAEKGLTDQQRIAINNAIDARKQAAIEGQGSQIDRARRDAQRTAIEQQLEDAKERQRAIESEMGKVGDAKKPWAFSRGVQQVAAEDGRFQSGIVAQANRAESFRDRAQNSIAAHTEKMSKALADTLTEIKKLTERLKVVRLY